VDEEMASWWGDSLPFWLCSHMLGDLEMPEHACFDKKLIKHPTEIIFHACSFMTYWARLYNSELQGKLMDGVKTLLACAHRVLAHQAGNNPRMLMAAAEEETTDEEDDE
jgi:hypothetical protein